MAFDRSKESKAAAIARRLARKGKESVRLSAIAAERRETPRKDAREDRRDWR